MSTDPGPRVGMLAARTTDDLGNVPPCEGPTAKNRTDSFSHPSWRKQTRCCRGPHQRSSDEAKRIHGSDRTRTPLPVLQLQTDSLPPNPPDRATSTCRGPSSS